MYLYIYTYIYIYIERERERYTCAVRMMFMYVWHIRSFVPIYKQGSCMCVCLCVSVRVSRYVFAYIRKAEATSHKRMEGEKRKDASATNKSCVKTWSVMTRVRLMVMPCTGSWKLAWGRLECMLKQACLQRRLRRSLRQGSSLAPR